ncbi:MAG: AmmeMemoRadiSam system protein B [Candidatus Omnitrophica bacterium]|nr:AmmeMemoRadiSam system protein B [Candidatus Omnitrophota bacterium]
MNIDNKKNRQHVTCRGILFLLAALVFCLVTIQDIYAVDIKKADLAGSWYPGSKEELSKMLDSYLESAKMAKIEGDIKAIIAPHAGIAYSGPVAAYAYNAVRDRGFKTVVILGFCHRKRFNGISVFDRGSFSTPLGNVEVDEPLARDIIDSDKRIRFYKDAFDDENSIEMELIFIKKVLPDAKIVPIAFGSSDFSHCELMAGILAGLLSKRNDALLVVSTDMSHYNSYENARKIDLSAIELLKDFNAKEIYKRSVTGEQLFCGYMPVAAALLMARSMMADSIDILKYANSGDVTGDKSRVVGYVSAAIYSALAKNSTDDRAKSDEKKESREGAMLSNEQQKRLLEIARSTIKTYLQTGKVMEIKEADPLFNKEMGAFVTLHEHGQLRGCIGNIIGRGPLYLTVRDMAIESATGDPRFPKVTLAELDDIDIEISVLSELEKVDSVDDIKMGVHGVLVRKGFSSGVFLPQVAAETGWSKEEFMTNLCAHKAGLLPDAWKHKDCDIYIFEAEVFGEKGQEVPNE